MPSGSINLKRRQVIRTQIVRKATLNWNGECLKVIDKFRRGRKAAPRKRSPLPLLTPEYLRGIPAFTKRYFESLYERLSPSHLLVFDNYQEVPEISLFHLMLANGLSAIPEGLDVIVLSRHDPPKEFARFIANRKVSLIGWDDLRFTEDESDKLAILHGGENISPERRLELHKKTKGWAAGLVLMTETKSKEAISLDTSTPELVFDYFAQEIFEKLDSQTQGFLINTAVLPTIQLDVAGELTDCNAGKILSRLSRANFFTERYPDGFYSYHPLFREFLLSKLSDTVPKREIIELRRKAAGLLEKSLDIEGAARLYRACEDWNGIGRLIRINALGLLEQGRNQIVIELMNGFPGNLIDPWLLSGLQCL